MGIEIKSDCSITVFNQAPKGSKAKPKKTLGMMFDFNKTKNISDANINKLKKEVKTSVLSMIFGADGNSKNLTEMDLKKAREAFNDPKQKKQFQALGVENMRYDEGAGALTLVLKNGKELKIDLETRVEQKKTGKTADSGHTPPEYL